MPIFLSLSVVSVCCKKKKRGGFLKKHSFLFELPTVDRPSIVVESSSRQRFRPGFLHHRDELYLTALRVLWATPVYPTHTLPPSPAHNISRCSGHVHRRRYAYFILGVISPTLIHDKISIVPRCKMEMWATTRAELNGNLNLLGYYPPR